MPSFKDALEQGRFVITTEEPPPRGADVAPFFRRTGHLRGMVDGINLTEASAGVMTMSPAGLVPGLVEQGHTPIAQITCRDRNRIALQAEVLAVAALGAEVIVGMNGDPVEGGGHPGDIAVHDLDTPGLLRMIAGLNEGHDMAGNGLHGKPNLFIGAVVNPGADDMERELAWMERKAEAGARFFQTQAIYDPALLRRFMTRTVHLNVPVIATYIVPKSGEMARRINRSVPGVHVPEAMIERLEAKPGTPEHAIEISGPILSELAGLCQGIHVIAVGWEARFPAILDAAGVARPAP